MTGWTLALALVVAFLTGIAVGRRLCLFFARWGVSNAIDDVLAKMPQR